MAIAFDAAVDGGNNGGASSSRTFAVTVGSGSDRMLAVAGWGDAVSDLFTGVTANGLAMTKATSRLTAGGRWNYFYYLLNPDSGTYNIVITASGTCYIGGEAASFTGVGAYEGFTSADAASTSITTVADNCWVVASAYANFLVDDHAPTNCTRRATAAAFGNSAILDTNGPKTPAGSITLDSGAIVAANNLSIILASFSPAGGGPAAPGQRIIGGGAGRRVIG